MNYYTGENEGNECDHEYESYGTIETETDFKGLKDLVGYECIHCKKSFEEWIYRN